MQAWPIWSLPRLLQMYLITLSATAAALSLWALGRAVTGTGGDWGAVRREEVLIFALLLTCAAVSVEFTRRQGEPAGVLVNDLLSAWWLPIAFLLPPVYVLIAPLPILAYRQVRVRQSLLHRRVFSAVATGLANGAASLVFHNLLNGVEAHQQITSGSIAALTWTGWAIACSLLAAAINTVLVAIPVKASSPESMWSELLWGRENHIPEIVELCTGVIIALVCALSPVLAIIVLIPLVFLQRGLMHRQLSAAARMDSKTALLNALTFEREANAEIARAKRTHSPLALMLVDIDHFKVINDQHGHLAGDKVLRAFAGAMSAQLRDYDLLARFGGDEFALLLPQTDTEEALHTASRLRRRLGELSISSGSTVIGATVSVGVAHLCSVEQDVTELLAAADLALYRAKARGRDRVEAAAPEAGEPAW